jgi:hypothetical protein
LCRRHAHGKVRRRRVKVRRRRVDDGDVGHVLVGLGERVDDAQDVRLLRPDAERLLRHQRLADLGTDAVAQPPAGERDVLVGVGRAPVQRERRAGGRRALDGLVRARRRRGRLVHERAGEDDVDGHRLVVVIREDAGAARVVAVGRVRRAQRAVVPVAGSDRGLAVDGGGEVAVQVALVGRPVDAERQGLLVEGVDREPVVPAPAVAGAADRVLREDGVDTAERRERGVANALRSKNVRSEGEVDRELSGPSRARWRRRRRSRRPDTGPR